MAYHTTDPSTVMHRLVADANRLARWANTSGDEEQKQLAYELTIALDHIGVKFGMRPPGAAKHTSNALAKAYRQEHPGPLDKPLNSRSNNDD